MNILFVCTGNTCRSAMAAALMNKIAMENNLDIRIDSAGIFADEGQRASENAVLAAAQMGADLSRHTAKQITMELINASDIILTMTKAHKQMLSGAAKDKVYTLTEYAHKDGDITDPYGGDLDEYRECARQIYDALLQIKERIAGNKS